MYFTLRHSLSRPLSRLRRFSRFRLNVDGVAAVEFAMVLPVMLIMYLGMAEVTHAVSADRKVTLLSRALADLTAQSKTVTLADMTAIFSAATAVLTPYASGDAQMVISSVEIDDGVAKIAWSCQTNGTARPVGEEIALPEGMLIDDTSLIMAEVTYPFTPAIGYVLSGTINLTETTYMRPRLVPKLASPGC